MAPPRRCMMTRSHRLAISPGGTTRSTARDSPIRVHGAASPLHDVLIPLHRLATRNPEARPGRSGPSWWAEHTSMSPRPATPPPPRPPLPPCSPQEDGRDDLAPSWWQAASMSLDPSILDLACLPHPGERPSETGPSIELVADIEPAEQKRIGRAESAACCLFPPTSKSRSLRGRLASQAQTRNRPI
jgi:hypothetical protein